MPRILSLYIIKETVVPFILTLVVLTATAMLGKIIRLTEFFLSSGISPEYAFWLIAGSIPPTLYFTAPMAYLMGVIIGFARLSADSELTAIKSGGVGVGSLLRPVMATAFAVFIVMLAIAHYAAPWSNALLYRTVFEVGKANAAGAMTEQTFYDRFAGVTLYIDRVSGDTGEIYGVFAAGEFAGEGESTVTAEKGRFTQSATGETIGLTLTNGVLRNLSSDGRVNTVEFREYSTELALSGELTGDYKRTNNKELYYGELSRKLKSLRENGPVSKALQVELEMHERFAVPLSVFFFALMGVPLGIQKVRSARFSGFGFAICVILAYYLLMKALESMVLANAIPAFVGAWGANAVVFAFAVYFVRKASREEPIVDAAAIEEFAVECVARITSKIGIKA